MGWEYGGKVGNEDAKVAEGKGNPDRVEALWGGEGKPDGPDHGHIVTNDGINAAYLREPGGEVVVNNPDDRR